MGDQGDLGPKGDMEPGEREWEEGITAAKGAGCWMQGDAQAPEVPTFGETAHHR